MTREAVVRGVGRWCGMDQGPSTLVNPGVVDKDEALLTERATPGLPVTLAVAADGRIEDRQIGEISAARLEELVTRLAAEATAP